MTLLAFKHQQGTSLLEILVAVVILSVGLLGVAGLQLTSLQSGYSAYQRSQATWLANDLADRMQAQSLTACTVYDDGSSDTKRTEWNTLLTDLLGADAEGFVGVCDSDGNVTIFVEWTDARGNIKAGGETDAGDQENRQIFEFRTRLGRS
ncbi:type IV pilus modification protein PilV [Pseudothauera rhizosphaerae]|uniref:Type IV pilus modification protein PilV n=1 Tax=Pseudothauera rhizosphaerae TaxID=2565932 RepID=A0A4S4AWP4_9RHOO|nr:type IV pilus modification protein PilV [Pseudothauera rhizosphaerae]THF64431.1 type IV pilus modification protein PilV [Pseudothauera rhizosphaerae]